jgi:hypothetical protein
VGETYEATVAVTDGAFELQADDVSIPSDANPFAAGDALIDIVLAGFVLSETELCGTVGGQVSQPIQLDLSGSTFGAIRTDDPTSIDVPLTACPSR